MNELPLLLKVGIFQFFDNLPPFLDALSPKLSKVWNGPSKSGQKTRIFGLFLSGLGALGAGSLGFGLNPKKHDDMKALFSHVPQL